MKKNFILSGTWFLATLMLFAFSSCEKNPENPDVDPDVDPEEDVQYFDLKVDNVTRTSAKLIYTPKFEGTYMSGILSWKTFEEEYQCDLEVMRDQDLGWYEFLAENYGGVWTDYLPEDITSGELITTSKKEGWLFQWNSEYMIYAFGIDADGTITTPVEYTKFQTLPRENKDLTFDIQINEIFSNGIDATITPSNNMDTYFVSLQRASYVDWWTNPENGVTEDDMMYELVDGCFSEEDLDSYIYSGTFHLTPEDYKLDRADADCYLIVFGFDDGPTTKMELIPYHSLPKE